MCFVVVPGLSRLFSIAGLDCGLRQKIGELVAQLRRRLRQLLQGAAGSLLGAGISGVGDVSMEVMATGTPAQASVSVIGTDSS